MSKEKELVQKAEQLYIYSLPLIVSEMVHRDYSDTCRCIKSGKKKCRGKAYDK